MTTLSIPAHPSALGGNILQGESAAKKSSKSMWEETVDFLKTSSGMEKLILSPIDNALRWVKWGASDLTQKVEPLRNLTGNTRTVLGIADLPYQVASLVKSYQEIPQEGSLADRSKAITQVAINAIGVTGSACDIVTWGSESSFFSLSSLGKHIIKVIGTVGSVASIVESVFSILKESETMAKSPFCAGKEGIENMSIERQKVVLSALKVARASLSILLGAAGLASLMSGTLPLLLLATTKVVMGVGIYFYELDLKQSIAKVSTPKNFAITSLV